MQSSDLTSHENIKAIYKTCFNQVKSMVYNNSGTLDDAQEVFQEAMIVLYQNSVSGKFQLRANVCTYLYRVAYNKWMKALRQPFTIIKDTEEINGADAGVKDEEEKQMQRQRLLMKCIENLGDKCRSVVVRFLKGMPGEKIAEELNYSSYEYYRLAKKRCLDNLKTMMQEDMSYAELKN